MLVDEEQNLVKKRKLFVFKSIVKDYQKRLHCRALDNSMDQYIGVEEHFESATCNNKTHLTILIIEGAWTEHTACQ